VVAEVIAAVAGKGILDSSAEAADHLLQGHGLRVIERDGRWSLLVAKSHDAVKALTKGSGFESDPWRQLERIPGAEERPFSAWGYAKAHCEDICGASGT
jgi:hypothetical protein